MFSFLHPVRKRVIKTKKIKIYANPIDSSEILDLEIEKTKEFKPEDFNLEKEQKELIKEAKKAIDDREAKRKAYIDSINALWNDFDNLSVEQQKDLLMKKMHGPKPFGKPGFHKGPKHCKKDFHKGHGPKGPRPEGPCQFGPKPHGPHPHGPRPDAPAK